MSTVFHIAEAVFAVLGFLSFLSCLILLLIVDADLRRMRRQGRAEACRRHPAATPTDWDAALAALTKSTEEH